MNEKILQILQSNLKDQIALMSSLEYLAESSGFSVQAEKIRKIKQHAQGLLETLEGEM